MFHEILLHFQINKIALNFIINKADWDSRIKHTTHEPFRCWKKRMCFSWKHVQLNYSARVKALHIYLQTKKENRINQGIKTNRTFESVLKVHQKEPTPRAESFSLANWHCSKREENRIDKFVGISFYSVRGLLKTSTQTYTRRKFSWTSPCRSKDSFVRLFSQYFRKDSYCMLQLIWIFQLLQWFICSIWLTCQKSF